MRSGIIFIALAIAAVLPATAFASSQLAPDCSPQVIKEERVKLYLAAAHEPLVRLASQIYLFAADSERCRLSDGGKACGLPRVPLKSTDLEPIFNYYVIQPVEAVLNGQQIRTRKGDWTWQTYLKQQ
ncbi:MAG TPA: hypothetical protein VMI06_12175 [Terriglobia bacterium]|nr:hypothetical protein [Terriglobia bacterium]